VASAEVVVGDDDEVEPPVASGPPLPVAPFLARLELAEAGPLRLLKPHQEQLSRHRSDTGEFRELRRRQFQKDEGINQNELASPSNRWRMTGAAIKRGAMLGN